MQNAYTIHDLVEEKVLTDTFPNKESAKEKRDEKNIEYYGKDYYNELLKSKETPRYIVIRSSSHPEGVSHLPNKGLNPAKAPNKPKKTGKDERQKILNNNKPKSKAEKRKAKK